MTGALGATYLGDGRCRFLVWAPLAERVEVRLLELPEERKAVRLWELLSEPGLDSEQ